MTFLAESFFGEKRNDKNVIPLKEARNKWKYEGKKSGEYADIESKSQ